MKSSYILKEGQMKIILEGNIDKKSKYMLKWSRKIKVDNIEYSEKFYIYAKKGILIINSIL